MRTVRRGYGGIEYHECSNWEIAQILRDAHTHRQFRWQIIDAGGGETEKSGLCLDDFIKLIEELEEHPDQSNHYWILEQQSCFTLLENYYDSE